MIKILTEFKEMLMSILNELKELKETVRMSTILNKEVLDINEASVLTGYKVSYLHKLSSVGTDLPIYSSSGNGKLYFKRLELLEWMTKHKRNNFIDFQNEVDEYFMKKVRKIA
ncbi:DNA-binding protein [Elizabethkingia anophelis]|nr:DNA-binding protein [Elizabethkingia anophelis]